MTAPIWLVLAAFVIRLAAVAAAWMAGRFPEFWEYDTIARNLLDGRGFVYAHRGLQYQAYVEPVYPFFVAAVYLLTARSVWALATAQCAVSALLAPVALTLARRMFGSRAGIVAGVMVAIHPGLAGYATVFHPLTFDALGMTLVALTAVALVDRADAVRAVAFGLAVGACTLTRPTILAFVALVLVWLASRADWKTLRHAAIAIVVAAIVVTPWVVRNHARLDSFVLTRSHVGFGLWLGNQPGATGGEGDPLDPSGARSLWDRAPDELRTRVLSQPDEIAQDRVFLAEARHYIAAAPGEFVIRTVRKLGYFWWFPPYVGKLYPRFALALYEGFYVLVLATALAGVLIAWRGQRSGGTVIVLLLLSVSVAQAVFYVQGRHRLALEALLIVLSAAALGWKRTGTET